MEYRKQVEQEETQQQKTKKQNTCADPVDHACKYTKSTMETWDFCPLQFPVKKGKKVCISKQ